MTATAASTDSRRSATSNHSRVRAWIRSSLASSSTAAASSAGSGWAQTRPLRPGSTSSVAALSGPVTSIEGSPWEAASKTTRPKPSRALGKTSARPVAIASETSDHSANPLSSMALATPLSATAARTASSLGPSPKTTASQERSRRRSSRSTHGIRAARFSGTSRPANTIRLRRSRPSLAGAPRSGRNSGSWTASRLTRRSRPRCSPEKQTARSPTRTAISWSR